MMSRLENIVAYLLLHYPYKNELSKARLTKLVYLADWFSALTTKKQMTNIVWVFNHYGPYVDDIANIAKENENFTIEHQTTQFGGDKYLISYNGKDNSIILENNEKEILNFVIDKTKNMYFDKFIDYIYSTYPVRSEQRYSTLNLETLAKEYKEKAPKDI